MKKNQSMSSSRMRGSIGVCRTIDSRLCGNNKKIIVVFLFLFIVMISAHTAIAKKKNVTRSPGGVNIAQTGFVIDAGYDKRLDTFIAGYKVINVAFVNQSLNIIYFDPERDKWSIILDGDKKNHQVIHDLRREDPKAWMQVPEKAKNLVSYPLVIPIGAREVIDLFVPDRLDLDNFIELDVYIASLDTKFEILVRQ